MRIGLFTDSYFPATNGIVYVVETLRNQLERMGHTVYVVAPKASLKRPRQDKSILWIPAVPVGFFDEQLTSLYFPPLQLRKIGKLDLDVIMFFTPGQIGLLGAYAALKLNVPLVSQYCTDIGEYIERYPSVSSGVIAMAAAIQFAMLGYSLDDLREMARAFVGAKSSEELTRRQHVVLRLLALLHDRCDAVVAVSPKMARQLRSWHSSAPVVTIPTGVDPLPAPPGVAESFRHQFDLSEDDHIVLYVGRLAEEKNLDFLIDSFEVVGKKDRRAKLVFVGDFMYREQLEAHAANTVVAERIIFAGRWPRERLGAIYGLANVFAFPSMTDTQALVVNEAAHAGVPFVWIDQHLNLVLQDRVSGLHAKAKPEDFAAKILRLLDNPSLRQKYGANSRLLAATVSEREQTQRLVTLFQQLIGES